MSGAAGELRQLATEEPDAFRAVAEKAQEPLRGRLLAILDNNGG